jgi:hypothetical protein
MALLALQRPYGKCSWSGESAHDCSVAGSHAMAHGDVEFELESDPSSKSACLLKSEISPNFPVSSPMTTSRSVTSPVLGLGVMVRRRWKDLAPSALHTQDPKTKVSPWLKATVGLMEIEAVESAMRSSARTPTWRTSYRCFRPATYQGEYPR